MCGLAAMCAVMFGTVRAEAGDTSPPSSWNSSDESGRQSDAAMGAGIALMPETDQHRRGVTGPQQPGAEEQDEEAGGRPQAATPGLNTLAVRSGSSFTLQSPPSFPWLGVRRRLSEIRGVQRFWILPPRVLPPWSQRENLKREMNS